MNCSALQRFLDAQTWLGMLLWAITLMVFVAVFFWLLRAEKRQFDKRGKGRSWLWMRVLALPMLAVTAAVILVPARSISGPEALGYFYIALFTLGPLAWFGLHWVAGAMQSPRFTRSESTGVAMTGLAILIVPPILVGLVRGPIFMASQRMQESSFSNVDQAPLAHTAMPPQRFRLGEAGEIYTQTLQAPADVHIERVESLLGGDWHDTATMTHPYLCRQGEDLHLAWSANSTLAPLRIFWRDGQGERHQSDFHAEAGSLVNLPARAFVVGWRDDGFDLPVPLAREVVQLGWSPANDDIHYRSLDSLQPGETFQNDCVMTGYRRIAWQQEGAIVAVMLRFRPTPPAEAWQVEFRRHP